MVSHPRQALDDFGHARQRPQVGAESVRAGASAERPLDGRELRRIQLRLASRAARSFEARPSSRLPRVEPVVGTDPGDA